MPGVGGPKRRARRLSYVTMGDIDPADRSDEELLRAIEIALFELNLFLRLASLRGFPVDLDTVERKSVVHPDGYTTVVASGIGAEVDK